MKYHLAPRGILPDNRYEMEEWDIKAETKKSKAWKMRKQTYNKTYNKTKEYKQMYKEPSTKYD